MNPSIFLFPTKAAQNLFTAIVSATNSVFLCYFYKKDGSSRRMLFIFDREKATEALANYNWNPEQKGYLPVWDVEAGGIRLVNLSRVRFIKQIKTRQRRPIVATLPEPPKKIESNSIPGFAEHLAQTYHYPWN